MQTLSRPGLSAPESEPEGAGRGRHPLSNFGRHLLDDPAEFAGALVSFIVVAGAVGFVFLQLQPGLLFGPNMDVGGDTAGHVVAVYYLIHHLLPHFQITGWDPQWFGGFPLYVFYFPLPAVIVAVLSVVFPYAVAFKLVTALGLLLMPIAAYAFGRLAGYRRPVPAVMAVAMLPMLFNFAATTSGGYTSWNIDGGTVASTMAGEFSFTLGVAFALLFLGVFSYALRTGRFRWLAAILFVATLLCHVVPALFAAGAAVVIALIAGTRRTWWTVLLPVGVVGGLLSAFWLLPFGFYLRYTASMGYGRVGNDWANLVPQNWEQSVQWIAVIGFAVAIFRLDRIAIALGVIATASALSFLFLPSGFVYNGRWLPFWFLSTALLAAYAVTEAGRALTRLCRIRRWHAPLTGVVAGGVTIALMAGWIGVLPFYNTPTGERNPAPGWSSWNYSGYQAKPGWQEFSSLIAMTEHVAHSDGCGLLDYEYSPNLTNWYGSTLAPMSLPLWTNGCIDTTEGLYYESSTTTDYHFLDQAQLSIDPSNPVVGIPYQSLNVADGIRHLQLMGVKYFLANSPTVEQAADSDPSLQKVGSVPASADDIDGGNGSTTPAGAAWDLYLIADSATVTPLQYAPVVESLSKEAWRTFSIAWYQNEQYWKVPVVTSGPSSWRRVAAGSFVTPAEAIPEPTTTVSSITTTDNTISFHVSKIGVPVRVAVPYFPNWQASGATGPYDSTPNLMVVVPTANVVTLHYGTTGIDWVGKVASVLGFVGAWVIAPGTTGTGLVPALEPGWLGASGVPEGDDLDEDGGLFGLRRRFAGRRRVVDHDDHGSDDVVTDESAPGHHHFD